MDGLTLTAVVTELKSVVIGSRIEKVQQPERDELLITIHSTAGGSCRLLISASPENGRVSLTDEKKPSPVDAPAFLMLMRKYLTGARICSLEQPFGDRIVEFGIETYSELRDIMKLTLVCEIMGRHSNIILIDGDRVVIDAIRRVNPSLSSARLVLPKVKYEYPPSKRKIDPKKASADVFFRALENAQKPANALSDGFYGLSPAVAEKLLSRLGWPSCTVSELAERLKEYYVGLSPDKISACIVTSDGRSVMTLPFEPCDGSVFTSYDSMNSAVSAFYSLRAQEESVRRRTSSCEHVIKNARAKLERKLIIFDEALSSEEEDEKYRVWGELLTANLYLLPNRSDMAVVTDWYSDPPVSVEIPLDPRISCADNAQRYFSRYRKAKLSRSHALKMRGEVEEEINYLDELLYTLSCCDGGSELNEIRQELIAGGYLKDGSARTKGGANKLPPSKPYSFTSRDGAMLLVGKNNRQNDRLTMSIARPEDIWLHTKDIHGSHVIIKRSGPVTDTTLYDAAMLAAYYSKARGSANVPVDYTEVRYVKKPSGAKPGMVIYTHQHTVYVTPDAEHVKKLML